MPAPPYCYKVAGKLPAPAAFRLAHVLAEDQREGYCRFVKLAGEKFREKNMQRLDEARENAAKWVLVEGCPQGCGKKILDSAGINPDRHFIVTSLGIERENRIDY